MTTQKQAGTGRSRRFSTTARQERIIAAICARTGDDDITVFRDIVRRGFEAVSLDEPEAGGPPDATAPERRDAPLEKAVNAIGYANLAAQAWSDHAMFGMLRLILAAVGQDPDDDGDPALVIAKHLCMADCSEPMAVWSDAGSRLADGENLFSAVMNACDDWGAPAERYAGVPRPGEATPQDDGKANGKEGNGKKKRKRGEKR